MTGVRSSTVDGVVTRSARRTPGRTAVRYAERSWTYAALDEAVGTAAAVLTAEHGLSPGDRVASYAHNSDAYLIAYLACARAGLVHVPVNQNLTGEDLAYILRQSGSTLVLTDPDLAPRLPDGHSVRSLRDAPDSLLGELDTPRPFTPVREPGADDLVQLLYTSGTTAQPKGAMMTHGALVHAYVSAVTALDLRATDRPVHSLPLYHSAQMHVFLLPYLAVGAENTILDAPDVNLIFDLVEAGRADSLFAPPTVWIGLANHPEFPPGGSTDCARRTTARRSCPCPSLNACASGCRTWRSTTASGRARSAPSPPSSAPTSTKGGWTPAGGPCSSSRREWSTSTARRCPTARRARWSTGPLNCARATGTSPRRARRPSATAGSVRAISPYVIPRATSPSSTG